MNILNLRRALSNNKTIGGTYIYIHGLNNYNETKDVPN